MMGDDRVVAKISGIATVLLPPIVDVCTLRDALKQAAGVLDSKRKVWLPKELKPGGRILFDLHGTYDLREHSDFVLAQVDPLAR